MELVLNRDLLPGEGCALMIRRGVEPEIGINGQFQADLIDISAWQLRKPQHYIAFPSAFLRENTNFYIGIAYFHPEPYLLALSYELSLTASDSALCPGACSSAGFCLNSDICECYNGYFDQDCSVKPPMLFVGETDIALVPSNGYFFGYFGTESGKMTLSLYWRYGELDIMWRNSGGSSALPTYFEADKVLLNVTAPYVCQFGSDTGQYILGLFNPNTEAVRVSIALIPSANTTSSNVVIVVICSVMGCCLILLWGLYVYCKAKHRHTTRIVPEIYIVTEPNTSLLLSLFPIEVYSNLSTDLNTSCSICLEAFCSADLVRILLCNHAYHVNCIDKWLKQQTVRITQFCCVCKRDYSKPEELQAEAQRFKAAKTSLGDTTRNEHENTHLNPTEEMDFTFSHGEDERS